MVAPCLILDKDGGKEINDPEPSNTAIRWYGTNAVYYDADR